MKNEIDFNDLKSDEIIKRIESQEIGNGIITLLSKAEPSAIANIMPTYSDELNEWLGIFNGSEDDAKKEKFILKKDSNTVIKHGTTFDLNTVTGLAYWNMVKHSILIAYSIEDAESTPDSMFYVEMPSVENKKTIDKERVQHKAVGLILTDTHENLKLRANVFNIADAESYDLEGLQNVLVNIAKKDPKRVLEIYGNNILSVNLLFNKALEKGIITESNNIYSYGVHTIGVSKEGALAALASPINELLLEKIKEHYDELTSENLFSKKIEPIINTEPEPIIEKEKVIEVEWKIGDEYPDNLVQLTKIGVSLGGDEMVLKGIKSKKNVIKEIDRIIANKK